MDVWTAPEIPDHPNALPESIGDAKGPDFTTMDAQLVIAQEKKLTVTPIRLEGPRPLDGSWSVKEVGYDVVAFEGSPGVMTVRLEGIVSVQVLHGKVPAPTPEPQIDQLYTAPRRHH